MSLEWAESPRGEKGPVLAGTAPGFAPKLTQAGQMRILFWAAAILMLTGACTWGGHGSHLAQRSISLGKTNRGRLRAPVRLQARGPGYQVPREWRERGNNFGTRQLVSAVKRLGLKLSQIEPARTIGVADLSPRHGGASPWHRSHQSGRDVDLLLLSVDARGRPLPPPQHEMIRYRADGRAYRARGTRYQERNWQRRRFDDRGNWRVVEGLLRDPQIRIQWIFISRALRSRLLAQAEREKAPRWLIAYAQLVMAQPAGVSAHDDHLHVRIYCPREDLKAGCRDSGQIWPHEQAGQGRYVDGEIYHPLAIRALSAHLAWIPRA